ncbi:DYN1 [[Candida] subhashii]|uniref:Dynein heavy chain, cytoplasmic n=1 Tax=[Candida] subhashii TaxID=561895 RepID=A0A8J5QBB9_9ASCO|nr:DYN1 [[Candida] subhashii]KAG7660522.1 DYN1 [[Candida] subhashii]
MEDTIDPGTVLSVDQLHHFIISFVSISNNTPVFDRNDDILSGFISSYNPDTLYICKYNKDEEFRLHKEINELEESAKSINTLIILIKSKGKLLSNVPLTKQLNIINIPINISEEEGAEAADKSNELFEKLRLTINLGLSPYFDLISASNEEASLATTKKKFNELSLSLQHLQQRIHIPNLLITTHPKITQLIEQDNGNNEGSITELLEDTTFLNEITSSTNNWIRQIQTLTRLSHDPLDGESIVDDIQFWRSMETALISLNQQINSPEVKLTIDVLNKAKRYHITLSFQNDIGLNKKLTEAKLYNSLLKEIPINDLIIINEDEDFSKFEIAIMSIFNHLKVKLNSIPLTRATETIEVILNDIVRKFQELLATCSIMSLPLAKFNQLVDTCSQKLCDIIEQNIKYLVNLLRELLRKRQEKFKIVKVDQTNFDQLRARLSHLQQFRFNHSNLLDVIENVSSPETKIDSINRLNEAYNQYIVPINVVDISHQGTLIWSMNEEAYLAVSNELNSSIIKRINSFFNDANTFIDFMALYNKFFSSKSSSGLLVSIYDEFKLKILTVAEMEIQKLIELNSNSRNEMMDSLITGIPSQQPHTTKNIVSEIIWNASLISKLSFYRENLENLLGSNWKSYSLGVKIDAIINKIINSLNPEPIFNKWIEEISQSGVSFESLGPILRVIERSNNKLEIIVNFDYSFLETCQQLNQLSNIGYKIPASVMMQYKKIHQLYPFVVGLRDHVNLLSRLFEVELQTSAYGKSLGFLVSSQVKRIEETLKEVIGSVTWIHLLQAIELQNLKEPLLTRSDNLVEVKSLNKLNQFQDSVIQLSSQLSKLEHFYWFMNTCKHNLKTVPFEFSPIESQLKMLQVEFNNLLLEKIEHVEELTEFVNKEVETILSERLQVQLFIFNKNALGFSSDDNEEIEIMELDKYIQDIDLFKHSLGFQDESFVLVPQLGHGKQHAFDILNKMTYIVESQIVIKPVSSPPMNFKNIIVGHELTRNEFNFVLEKIEHLYDEAEEYIDRWRLLQNLWELNLEDPEESLKLLNESDSVLTWFKVVQDVLENRRIFDQAEPEKKFAQLFIVDFGKVQNRVTLKFDAFQKQLLNKFSKKLESESTLFNHQLVSGRETLEVPLSFHLNSKKLISNIDNHFGYKQRLEDWNQKLVSFRQIQNYLFRHRFKFPPDWMYTEQLENNLSMVASLIERKDKLIEEHLEIISSKVKAEATKVNDSIKSLSQEWATKKPISGNLNPSLAIVDLDNFQTLFTKLETQSKSLLNVSTSLNISIGSIDDVSLVTEEIKDLKSVWSSVNVLWEDLERLKNWKWSEFQPRQLYRTLDDLLNASRSLPVNIRQYAAVDEIQNSLKNYVKTHSKISELKGDCMKPRHWKVLLGQLGSKKRSMEDLTVGDVWNLNIALNIQTVNAILEQANNERTIEEKLNSINSGWSSVTFELSNYENKCRLVKNWDNLFDQCNNDISALSSMKNSPYFGSFEREISELEKKLNILFVILDTWIEVQRQWVYLDGVFGNHNNDIKSLLPIETTRFTNITYEFFNILKRIYKFNLVIDIILVGDIQPTMNKFLDSLTKVRKSLTDYLEKQRELFPRFYFVGNEDLLEIIGGSHDVNRVNRHFKKMFGGIQGVRYINESSSIVGVYSEEGEELKLNNPISLIKFTRLNEWLKELELETRLSISQLVKSNISVCKELFVAKLDTENVMNFLRTIPTQVATLSIQIYFTNQTEESLKTGQIPQQLSSLHLFINMLTKLIDSNISNLERKKIQYLAIETIHQRDILERLMGSNSEMEKSSIWNLSQRFYYDVSNNDLLTSLTVKLATSSITYGFEYLGIPEKLAYTPLINDCFTAMSQAISMKQGGSPFGPAGTGKTESVKALGHNLGKMVLVFCCDESFDFQSMGRIFLGLCKVGIWGCFDEFNRLDDKNLSAVSHSIENIEHGLRNPEASISVSGRDIKVNPDTGIFVTMNPGYVGRNELPENLKKLFRSFAMTRPDSEKIVEVILTSQAFEHSRELAKIIVPFFSKLDESVSKQAHYDFGLRALKSMLLRCGVTKRRVEKESELDTKTWEYRLVLQSVCETILPKLVRSDELLFEQLIEEFFLNVSYEVNDNAKLIFEIEKFCESNGLLYDERWVAKALQLYDIQKSHHGIMLVGEAGSGKSSIMNSLVQSLSVVEEKEHVTFHIDAKVLSKDQIYGKLDLVTRDWVDGLFTSILRKIRENLRGELSKRIWIVFDGDIDPRWAENLNSVLDDNKILTLPNGERLGLPPNVRIVFEVDSLRYTTPATVSRTGMVWFDKSLISVQANFRKLIHQLRSFKVDVSEDFGPINGFNSLKNLFVDRISEILNPELLLTISKISQKIGHIMEFSFQRAVKSFEISLRSHLRRLLDFATKYELPDEIDIKKYASKAILLSFLWTFAGDASQSDKEKFSSEVSQLNAFTHLEPITGNYIDFDISLPDCEWISWNSKVEAIELEPHEVASPNLVVPTIDTVRHEYLVYSILNEHRPLLLCGPPGSGKTMTLFEALRKSPRLDVLSLNFSKETSPLSLMKSLEQFCEYKKTNRGISLSPKVNDKWVVVFCDEINLPKVDKYGTQRVISLIRMMIEHKGFWRIKDQQWVSLENIQFVGACNSPNDPGRNKLSERFLRHASLIMVDYPGIASMNQIYQTFNLALLKCAPDLRGFAKAITDANIEIYQRSRERFTTDIQSHYIYSPRELTRWSRGLLEALKSKEYTNFNAFLRLWYHEGLRLFYDRLVTDEEKGWTLQLFHDVSLKYFPNIDLESCFEGPVLFTNWLTLNYESANKNELKSFLVERLRVFSEEETEVDLVLHEDMLDHALRIDRVLRQPQGHMLLVGPSTSGRSTLSKFVAWINGLKIEQLHVKRNYTVEDFDDTLRKLLLRCASGERVCFIIDESSILETSFVERMNTLLANAEVPGLFEGDDHTALMNLCLEISHANGLFLDTDEELYGWFTEQISQNLHVIFSISDTKSGNNNAVVSSPALFNRCVLSWMGDWSDRSLYEIATARIDPIPLDVSTYSIPATFEPCINRVAGNFRDVIVDVMIFIHHQLPNYEATLFYERAPSNFLNFVEAFSTLFHRKQSDMEESQRHISVGLDKLRETMVQVNKLKTELAKKKDVLSYKDKEAREMLNKMITDQNEAERRQEFSVATQADLEKQEIEIEKRRKVVLDDLAEVEPTILEAQRGVQNIKKQHLTEIRSMMNPPAAVKMTMESVCILLGYDVVTWRDVQSVIRREDFISNIVRFETETKLTPEIREYMEQVYLSREDYTFEVVHRASKACGPLVVWVKAQLNYSKILQRIDPLREEMRNIELETKKTRAKLIAIDQMISELNASIESYKTSYSEVIRDAENIKTEMRTVETKVQRSLALIENLKVERERWKQSVSKFGYDRERLVGNSLLVSAFVVYAGIYDQKGRLILMKLWKEKLLKSGVVFDENLSIANYLTDSKEILRWVECGLTNDELNVDNLSLLQYAKTPIVIDPASSIVDILEKADVTRSVTITSFLNDGLVNQLENALRFGGTIVIQDCEYYDPLLDPILRREVKRNGGRMIITLGDQMIDFSPNFKLILCTKDPQIVLPSSVSSRTSIVNFTITSGSLENRTLDIALKVLKPDVEKKRADLITLSGEYRVRLESLEKELLDSLNQSAGEILENDYVLETLERLKSEAIGINEKLDQSADVISSVEETRNTYQEIAKHSSAIYAAIEMLGSVNPFYSFSLSTFISQLTKHLVDYGQDEVPSFIAKLYQESFAGISPSLQFRDKIIFGLLLGIAYYSEDIGNIFKECLLQILKSVSSDSKDAAIGRVFEICLVKMEGNDIDVAKLLEMNQDSATLKLLSKTILTLSDPNQRQKIVETFSDITPFLYSGAAPYSSSYDLDYWCSEGKFNSIIMTCPDGFDASYKVEKLALESNKKLAIVSMGSKEGIEIANSEIERAIQNDSWVIIQNIQMSPQWVTHLEMKLNIMTFGQEVRIFLTCTNKSKLPAGLIARSKVLNFETELGLARIVLDTFKSIPSKIMESGPIEIRRVFVLLIWYHSVITERSRYVPVSFKKTYDINDSDFASGCYVIRHVFEPFMSRTNIDPKLVPWEILRHLIGTITYSSKVSDEEDKKYFKSLAEYLFTEKSFDATFNLIENDLTRESREVLNMPEGNSISEYKEWIMSLPDQTPLSWIGLQENANTLVDEKLGQEVASRVVNLCENS